MLKKLQNLYSSLSRIETKGESTLIMADSLMYLSSLIKEQAIAEEMAKAEIVEGATEVHEPNEADSTEA